MDPLIKDMLKMLLVLHLALFFLFIWVIGRRLATKHEAPYEGGKG